MIVFICSEPTPQNERDGLMQRVTAIDSAFEGQERTILSLSFFGNQRRKIFRRSPVLTVEYLNVMLHWPRIAWLARRASAVYVHTCNQAFRILPLYFMLRNIVTDLHGALVEEIAMEGKRFACWRYRHIERIVVKRSAALVYVTHALKTHIENKYRTVEGSAWVVPVFSKLPPPPEDMARNEDLAIYAGGLQSWQCIDEMLTTAVKTQDRLRFLFLTGHPEALQRRAAAAGLKARIESTPWSELPGQYAQAAMGFVLRDDSVVNAVACPTKLIEYLHFGVVPVVKLEQIGDFPLHDYQYIKVADLVQGRIPSLQEMEAARIKNRIIVEAMAADSREQLERLVRAASSGTICAHVSKPGHVAVDN
jgi:hypothetical protein